MRAWLAMAALLAACLAGCHTTHTVTVEPIKVEPITMTLNINLKVDKQLDDFFGFQDEFDDTDSGDTGNGEEGGR